MKWPPYWPDCRLMAAALRQRIDYRIREMKNDGRYNAIFRQYDAEPQP